MYVTIAPGSDKDLPVLHHEYLFAAGANTNYRNSNSVDFIRKVDWLPTQNLADTVTLSTLSNNRGGVT